VKNLSEERFNLAHSFRGVSLSWWGRHGGAEKFIYGSQEIEKGEYRKGPGQDIVRRIQPQ
jgi:hypothetical protein